MKQRIVLILLLALSLAVLIHAGRRFQYGFKAGVVVNSFDEIPGSLNNPFGDGPLSTAQLGYIAGVFYDYQL